MENEKPILPSEIDEVISQGLQVEKDLLQEELNKIETPKPETARKVFIGIPTTGEVNAALVLQMFNWARDPGLIPWFHLAVERRPTDYARNTLVAEFLKTDCTHLVMIDDDVCVPPNFLSLIDYDKDIIAGNTQCWMADKLVASVWQKAKCEQCFCLEKWFKEGIVHDPREYFAKEDCLWRWNPFRLSFERFATRNAIFPGLKCRCRGTGLDPWVFTSWRKEFKPGEIINCDSVGTASIIIARRVIEKMAGPHFQFLHRPARDILLTEDHYFCWKAQQHGFEVWADLDMVCSHFKLVNLAGIMSRMIFSFNAGAEFQKTQTQNQVNIIVPSEKQVMELGNSKIVPGT